MLNFPVIRWGKPYESLDSNEVVHFTTGETLAKVSQANPGLLVRDMKKAQRARDTLLEVPVAELCSMMEKAADLFMNATLPVGDGEQSPQEFCHIQSASTGLPEHMAEKNMHKNGFVMANMTRVLDALTRGISGETLTNGYGVEELATGGKVVVSFQAQTPVLGMVLPSNSPGVHTLWLPAIPMQVGLILKPGSSEPWTPYRVASAMFEAGIPREAIGIYPGGHDMGPEVINRCPRTMVFGGQATIDMYADNPRVQAHGPGYSKIFIGDDVVDQWEDYLDLMVDSVLINGGRSCINCSGIWASRHTEEIAQALAERLGPVAVTPPDDPEAKLAAFTNKQMATGTWDMIEERLKESGVTNCTAGFGDRLVEQERCAYLRPMVVHCDSPDREMANTEYMFPFVSVVQCPQEDMIEKASTTLIGSAFTNDPAWSRQLIAATNIDRLNIGPIPTNKMDWLQPHEGNIVDFLFRQRAFQAPEDRLATLLKEPAAQVAG